MATPDISIVIPAYNVENYICAALESVLAQTDDNVEIIIVNDGSTDCTAEKIAGYEKDHVLKVYHTENQGLGPARNYGLERTTGEYVYFFDADDLLNENFINEITSIINLNNHPDIIFFSGESFADEGFQVEMVPCYERQLEGLFQNKDFPIRKMQMSKCFFGSACLYVSKRGIWVKNDLSFKNIIHEDEEVLFPLVSMADSIYITKRKLFFRRLRQGSIMRSGKSRKNIEAYRVIIKSLADFFRRGKGWSHFDLFAFRRRMRFFVLRYSVLSKEQGSRAGVRFLLRVMFQVGDYALILVWLLGKMPEFARVRLEKLR